MPLKRGGDAFRKEKVVLNKMREEASGGICKLHSIHGAPPAYCIARFDPAGPSGGCFPERTHSPRNGVPAALLKGMEYRMKGTASFRVPGGRGVDKAGPKNRIAGEKEEKGNRRLRLPVLAGIATMVFLCVVLGNVPAGEWILQGRAWLQSHGQLGFLLYGLIFTFATSLFLPSSVFMIGAGFIFGWGWGTVLSSASSLCAIVLCLLCVRHAGHDFRRHVRNSRHFQSINRIIEARGMMAVALLRLSPIPFGLGNCLYSLTSVPVRPYLFASWVGLLPVTLAFNYLGFVSGAILLGDEGRPMTALEEAFAVAGTIIMLMVLLYFFRQGRLLLQGEGRER
jgi:uncharacterized membrane protein YdjX (TVP38/TMEM64 family)